MSVVASILVHLEVDFVELYQYLDRRSDQVIHDELKWINKLQTATFWAR